MFLRRLPAAVAVLCALILAPLTALAGPISGYPAATTPLTGSETVVGTQGGSTVQVTTGSIATIATSALTGPVANLGTATAQGLAPPIAGSGAANQGATFIENIPFAQSGNLAYEQIY